MKQTLNIIRQVCQNTVVKAQLKIKVFPRLACTNAQTNRQKCYMCKDRSVTILI